MATHRVKLAGWPVAVALVGGCAFGPDYSRPELSVPNGWDSTSAISTQAPGFTTARPSEQFWEVFQDKTLDELVRLAKQENQGLKAAYAHVQAERAFARQRYLDLVPNVSANGELVGEQLPKTTAGFGVTPGEKPYTATAFMQGTLDMAYELDLWGRVRRGAESAQALAIASDEERKTVEITLAGDVCEAYFDLGAAEAEIAIAEESVRLRQSTLDHVKMRFDTGEATELDFRRAQAEVETAGVVAPEARRARAVALHRLAVLTGRLPSVVVSASHPGSLTVPPTVPVGLPSELLERRPDVRAAEHRLVAANAQIGQAIAGFFPRVTLLGQLGEAAFSPSQLAGPGALLFTFGPQVHIPLLEQFANQQILEEKEARTEEAIALYRDAVLRAFAEVADAMTGLTAHAEIRTRQGRALEFARRAVSLADTEYRLGATTHLEVLDAERSLLVARLAALRAQRQELSDLVKLGKALGGGWTAAPPDKN